MESVDDVAAAILDECERQYPGETVTTERGAAAASFAIESPRLEGRVLSPDAVAELEHVAAGRRSGDDAVAALLASHRRPS